MADERACRVCGFFSAGAEGGALGLGECRRWPAVGVASAREVSQPLVEELMPRRGEWPYVGAQDWCGEFKEAGETTIGMDDDPDEQGKLL
jgi:hypothetical protein